MQVRGEKDYTSLVKGLITERSPILGEEQACQDELNFVFDLATGTRVKRKGFRTLSAYTPPSLYNPALRTRFHWADQNLLVDVYQETTTHDGRRDTVVVLLDDSFPYASVASVTIETEFTVDYTTTVQVSSLRDKLFVSSGSAIYVLDKIAATSLNVYSVDLFIRDFKLVPDGLRVGQRTGALTDEHLYNLYNAGWYAERKLESTGAIGDPLLEFGGEAADISTLGNITATSSDTFIFDYFANDSLLVVGGKFQLLSGPNAATVFDILAVDIDIDPPPIEGDPVVYTYTVTVSPSTVATDSGMYSIKFTGVSDFPSNADIPILGLKADEEGDELFSKNTLLNVSMGNSEAPRGHYVYNILNIDRNAKIDSRNNDGTPFETVTLITSVSW